MKLRDKLRVPPGRPVHLADWDPGDTLGFKKGEASQTALAKSMARLDELQYVMFAEHQRALLVVLQGMDGSGKDGTIRHVMTGLNPQGCRVTAFKTPSADEADRDFLWRVHREVPRRGDIAIFNRSHYEDVLIARVRKLVPQEVWSRRYDRINQFEELLCESGVNVVKFFLHISKEEQKERFEERLRDPTKQWKLSAADFAERKLWNKYEAAYEDALTRCSSPTAPWYIVPADKKWFRNLAISHLLVETLDALDMRFPKATFDPSQVTL